MKRVQLDRNDLAILEMAFRYCRTLKAVEYAHAIGDEDDLWMCLDSVDPVDVKMVADHLEKLWRLATLAPDVGTEPREGDGGSRRASPETCGAPLRVQFSALVRPA